jgi:SH3-like domain-containing protein
MAIPAAIILIIIALCSFVFSLSRRSFIENRNAAIITDISIGVKSSPDMQGTSIFILHEGTRVTILDRLDTWNEIRTGNGNVGWVPESSLTVI